MMGWLQLRVTARKRFFFASWPSPNSFQETPLFSHGVLGSVVNHVRVFLFGYHGSDRLRFTLSHSNIKRKSFTQCLYIAAQAIEGIRIIAAFFHACNLCLGNAKPPGKFGLREASFLARLNKLQPEFLFSSLLFVDRCILRISP